MTQSAKASNYLNRNLLFLFYEDATQNLPKKETEEASHSKPAVLHLHGLVRSMHACVRGNQDTGS